MFTVNPFVELSATISPSVMQTYVWLMILCVAGGTIFDVIHKQSAKYFFANMKKSRESGDRQLSSGQVRGIALKTLGDEVLTSSEFCNPNRRLAHLLTMYGFIAYVVATAVMVFSLPGEASGFWTFLWWVGILALAAGCIWFWFFIRVDVAAEGGSPFRLMRADLFVVSLMTSAVFGILWALTQGTVWLALYLIATTVLFGSVPWSKFSHMFFKPAAAMQKKIAVENGALDNLPRPADRTNPSDRDRHSMELLKDAPLNMGLGIKREDPRHY